MLVTKQILADRVDWNTTNNSKNKAVITMPLSK